jgi:hypothetical protein
MLMGLVIEETPQEITYVNEHLVELGRRVLDSYSLFIA